MLKPHRRIYLAAFLLDAAVMVGVTVLPFYVFNQLGGGAAMSGAFGAAFAAAYATTALLSSSVVSRAKHGINWAIMGATGFTVTFSLLPFFRVPLLCGGLVALSNFWCAFAWPAMHSWIGSDPDLRRRGRRMARFNMSWSFGFAVSTLLGGMLYDADYRYPFVLLVALGMGAVLLLKSLPHEADYFGKADEQVLRARVTHDRASEAHLYAAWASGLLIVVLVGASRSVFPKRIEELVAAGELRLLFEPVAPVFLNANAATRYSWLSFALTGTCALMFLVLGRTERWRHRFHYLAGLQLASAGAFWLLSSTHSFVLMLLCFVVVGATNGLAFFSAVYYSMANPALKHRRAAINEGAVGTGGFIGSIVCGLLASRYGIAMPFRWTPLFVVAGVAVQMGLLAYGLRRQRRFAAVAPSPVPDQMD